MKEADWERYGRAAGPKRNKLIVDAADVVIAFPSLYSKGTLNTIKLAKKAGKQVEVQYVQDEFKNILIHITSY